MQIGLKTTIVMTALCLGLLGVALRFSEWGTWIEYVRIITGSCAVLAIPGYWLTQCFFPEKRSSPEKADLSGKTEDIDGLERFVLSIALSISMTPLLLFYANFLGLPLTLWNIYWTICIVTLAGVGGHLFIIRRHAQK